MSEKSYWVILIVGLIIFVLLIGFVLIPYEILDYNLGINLISEGIGILVTVVFLTWLFNLRDTLQWKSVKDTVLKRIGIRIHDIFLEMVNLVQVNHKMPQRAFAEEFKSVFFLQLEELNNKTYLLLGDHGEKILSGQDFFKRIQDDVQFLNNMEMKYFKFLDPPFVQALMQIQFLMNGLVQNLRMKKRILEFMPEEKFLEALPILIHEIIKEIYKIHKMGIEIYYT